LRLFAEMDGRSERVTRNQETERNRGLWGLKFLFADHPGGRWTEACFSALPISGESQGATHEQLVVQLQLFWILHALDRLHRNAAAIPPLTKERVQ
jgi:hypothetical protein